LLPGTEDRRHRQRDGAIAADDEAAAARGRRVLPVPERAPRGGALKHLVVTADDFGLAQEVNEAVDIAHRDGILSAASLMVAGAASDAVARALRLPKLRVGLHVVLVEGQPALPPEKLPDLVDSSGRLRTDMARLGFDIFARPTARAQLAAEVEAQFAAFAATGL